MELEVQRAKLRPVQDDPYNAETPLTALVADTTPVDEFYVRNHFPVPSIAVDAWALLVSGAVERPAVIRMADLQGLPQREVHLTLECAGNGRTLMEPFPGGTPWDWGAAGHARFRGAALADVLAAAGVATDAVEVLAIGADEGRVDDVDVPFARSLPMAKALDPDTLVAWEMNGAPLTADHGAPARLVVPGWYAVSSVKWLIELEARTSPFEGVFQSSHYRYVGEGAHSEGAPTEDIRVRALIGVPAAGDQVGPGSVELAGTAWSDGTGIGSVEVSADGGATWLPAEVRGGRQRYAPATWRATWDPPGPGDYTLAVRATDVSGGAQPLEPVWNQRGYGNNVVHRIGISVT